MSTRREADIDTTKSEEEKVARYLRKHPDFFENHMELLEELTVPHPSGDAVSLVERQVAVLREKNYQLKQQLHNLLKIARDNDKLNESVQHLTLSLMAATSLEEVLCTVYDNLIQQLRAEAISIVLWQSPEQPLQLDEARTESVTLASSDDGGIGLFEAILTKAKPVCGKFKADQLGYLFANQGSEIASAAVLPLSKFTSEGMIPLGMIGIGSRDPDRFNAQMGTVFLNHLAEVTACAVQRYVDSRQLIAK